MKNVLIIALAIIGACALTYVFWVAYEQHLEKQRERAIMTAPPQVQGMPDFRKPSTSPPPPQ